MNNELIEAWDKGADAGAKLQHEIEQAKHAGTTPPGPVFNPYRSQT